MVTMGIENVSKGKHTIAITPVYITGKSLF